MPETTRKTARKGKRPIDGAGEGGGRDGARPLCSVAFCPICLTVTAAQTAAPDAVEHLLSAAREFFLAARAVIDARAEDLQGARGPTKLERVEIA